MKKSKVAIILSLVVCLVLSSSLFSYAANFTGSIIEAEYLGSDGQWHSTNGSNVTFSGSWGYVYVHLNMSVTKAYGIRYIYDYDIQTSYIGSETYTIFFDPVSTNDCTISSISCLPCSTTDTCSTAQAFYSESYTGNLQSGQYITLKNIRDNPSISSTNTYHRCLTTIYFNGSNANFKLTYQPQVFSTYSSWRTQFLQDNNIQPYSPSIINKSNDFQSYITDGMDTLSENVDSNLGDFLGFDWGSGVLPAVTSMSTLVNRVFSGIIGEVYYTGANTSQGYNPFNSIAGFNLDTILKSFVKTYWFFMVFTLVFAFVICLLMRKSVNIGASLNKYDDTNSEFDTYSWTEPYGSGYHTHTYKTGGKRR